MKKYSWVFFVLFSGHLMALGRETKRLMGGGFSPCPHLGIAGEVNSSTSMKWRYQTRFAETLAPAVFSSPFPGTSRQGGETPHMEASAYILPAATSRQGDSPGETPLSDAEIRVFKEAVRKAAAQTESLTADFIQARHSRYLAKAAESRGKLSFRKPGYVLWKYTAPSSYSVLFRENKMYINDAGKKKDVNAGKRLEKLNKLIAGSVTGDMFDAPEFTFSYARSGEKTLVRLKTKEASLKKYIREIELTFENNTVSEVKMTEPSDDHTRIILRNKVLNGRVDPGIFVP